MASGGYYESSSLSSASPHVTSSSSTQILRLEEEIIKLKQDRDTKEREISSKNAAGDKAASRITELENTKHELETKQRLSFLLDRVAPSAQTKLLAFQDFQEEFLSLIHI